MSIRLYCEICSVCNLQCKYCFEKEYTKTFLPSEQLLSFIDIVKNMIDDVVITGGEPTLHPDFDEIVCSIAQRLPVIITTNGTTNNAEYLAYYLKKYPNLQVQISLDAYNMTIVDNFCGDGVFNTVISTIDKLSTFGERICIASTLLNQPEEELAKLSQYVKDHNIRLYFPNLLPFGALNSNWDMLMPPVREYIKSEEYLLELVNNSNEEMISSNKVDTIISRFFSSLDDETNQLVDIVLKIDSTGHLLTCPATDYSYKCSRLGDIKEIDSVQKLQVLLKKYTPCISAKLLDDTCIHCPVEKYCKRVFCGNCIHMTSSNISAVQYLCETYKHHFTELLAAKEEL